MSESRALIINTFAGWTALSALRRSPVKSRARIYPLVQATDFAAVLKPGGLPISAAEFNAWHRKATRRIRDVEPVLCVGWAAKLVNVY
jgi:hypothetical protein